MYEPSEDITFDIHDQTGQHRDRFAFYGPFSVGYELAIKRAALYDATEITAFTFI